MDAKLVPLDQSSGFLESRPKSESTSAVEKRRSDGCEGRSESEQKRRKVDRFLQSGLKPSILRHGDRSKKTVHSIIRYLIQSDKQDNCLSGGEQASQTETCNQTSLPLNQVNVNGDVSKQNLSSSVKMLSNEDSSNVAVPYHHFVQAANMAARWLDLIHDDTKRRMAVLQVCIYRVRSAIQNHLYTMIPIETANPNKIFSAINKMKNHVHGLKWNGLFCKMKRALTDEEQKLKCMLAVVQTMKLQCDSCRMTVVWRMN